MNLDFLNLDKEGAFRDWRGIVMHHSATKDSVSHDWEGIRRFHTSYRYDGRVINKDKALMLEAEGVKGILHPWQDIGYHFGIELVGTTLQVQKGRSLALSGAHAKEYNQTHIGICVVGNFDIAEPQPECWEFSLNVVREILKEFPFTKYDVLGHRETFTLRGVPVEKTCPGKYWNMDKFRDSI